MTLRRIAVVTGSRAEYGLLRPVMRRIAQRPGLELCLVVTGSHLSQRYGHTIDEIIGDGFSIDARVAMPMEETSRLAAVQALGMATMGMGEALARLSPHIVVVLGDRYELLAVAQACLLLGLPLAHIHGGEVTEGALDDSVRHAVSKMAQLHFAATETYRRRLIRMGEAPERVFATGSPGFDELDPAALPGLNEVSRHLGVELSPGGYLAVTYHPVTLAEGDPADAVAELTAALDCFPQLPVVITGVNADPGADRVAFAFHRWLERQPKGRAVSTLSLGRSRYLALTRHAAAVAGNSSSGIIEVPSLGTPVINVGDRQKGRDRSAAVIDCAEARADIVLALNRALSEEHRRLAATAVNPYAVGGGSEAIVGILAEFSLDGLRVKAFYDGEQ